MYKIRRQGGKLPVVLKNIFDSYNAARSAVRKWLRLQEKRGALVRTPLDLSNRTATIGTYGFSVLKCAQ
jgi:hypothetical protein